MTKAITLSPTVLVKTVLLYNQSVHLAKVETVGEKTTLSKTNETKDTLKNVLYI